jgi:hypothetical protein
MARAWPAVIALVGQRRAAASGRVNSRSVLATADRLFPTALATSSWVKPKPSS